MSAASARVSTPARPKTGGAHAVPPRIERIALPHRDAMASRYGSKVAHLPVYSGPAVEMALKRHGAEGAAVDGAIFLPAATAAPDLVAHEVVHALQQPLANGDGEAFLHRLETAPAATANSAVEKEAGVLARPEGVPGDPAPMLAMPGGVVALRRSQNVAPSIEVPAAPLALVTPVTPEQAAPAVGPETAAPVQARAAASGSEAEVGIAPIFTAPAMPRTLLDPAEAATREAARAEAEAAVARADSPSAVMDAYARMAPSVKALHSGELGARLSDTNANSTGEIANGMPEVSARLSGTIGDLPAPVPIVVPGEDSAAPSAAAAAPAIEVPAGPEQPQLRTDPAYGGAIERMFSAGADPERIGDQINQVSTANPGIQTRVTDRADIPLEGANDPARIDEHAQARGAEAAVGRQAATGAVVTGLGPEIIVPREMEYSFAIEVTTPETAALAQPEGAAQFNAMTLPGEVVARFDEDTGPAMAASADAARDQMQAAESERNTAHADAVQTAETDRAAAEQQADASQRTEVVSRRESIQAERQRTVDAQQAAVQQVNAEAETARAEHRADADERVRSDRTRIDSTYDQAERDSQAEADSGERRAENERQRAERESEDQSWWDHATSFIRRAFEVLMSAINAIFDAARSAVAAIIDAAVNAVTEIIVAAAAALQALVSAFGELLKGLIDGLLGQIFPELACALTQFIAEAMAAVNQAIDGIADTLVAAVQAVGATLNAAINVLLELYQNAIDAALAALQAVMTGDWGALLLKVLDAILRMLGIDPAAFHALIAQASDAVDTVVNNPSQFVQNLLDAVVGGVQQFADHFGAHLRDGIIGWLTGALGGIQMPAQWDIWGVLDIVRQILGLTWDFVRERAARIIGQENVARLEAAFNWIATLVTEGWSGLWNRLMRELESLKDMVMEAIRNFVLERVVMAAIRWLASLFSPVGAVVQLVMTIWNVYQFVSNQLQRLFGIAQAVVQGISSIAHGVLGPAMNRVEQVLADLLPVVIDLLMSLLGVTGVAARVREIIGDVRAAIARAVDNLLDRVLGALGLRRGGAAREDADDTAIGESVPVDVAEGEDHTITVEYGPSRRLAVIMRSDPKPMAEWLTDLARLAGAQRDDTRRAEASAAVTRARATHAELEAAALATPPAAGSRVTQLERELAADVKIVFDIVTPAGRDRQLAEAVSRFGIVNFLVGIAKGQSPGGIGEARLEEELWPGAANRENREFIKNAFRAADPGMHEWIPTNYIPNVIARASAAREGEETAETAALWVLVYHRWRSPTEHIIFTPIGRRLRRVRLSTAVAGATDAVVLQGHVGAIYAAAERQRETPGVVQAQTQGQGPWHEDLRRFFREESPGTDSRAAIASVIDRVEQYAEETVWGGALTADISRFTGYYTNGGASPISLLTIQTTGRDAMRNILTGFTAARGVLR
ncbi:hypothetical protein AWB78_07160 [Caballeronia calidae]|uniref:eCIS core domain-containing protein n=1 Tax=Caballeronia calidae TaxID=1777139 RepID=A0A158EDC3_9BURK|nr:DUF4157 domain-containing protein [Caballeronia calidae]SAL04848.1 hypothetical protein AWB78_07160 [Caballeronia calidae]